MPKGIFKAPGCKALGYFELKLHFLFFHMPFLWQYSDHERFPHLRTLLPQELWRCSCGGEALRGTATLLSSATASLSSSGDPFLSQQWQWLDFWVCLIQDSGASLFLQTFTANIYYLLTFTVFPLYLTLDILRDTKHRWWRTGLDATSCSSFKWSKNDHLNANCNS